MIYFVGLGKLPKFSKSNLNVLINFTFFKSSSNDFDTKFSILNFFNLNFF